MQLILFSAPPIPQKPNWRQQWLADIHQCYLNLQGFGVSFIAAPPWNVLEGTYAGGFIEVHVSGNGKFMSASWGPFLTSTGLLTVSARSSNPQILLQHLRSRRPRNATIGVAAVMTFIASQLKLPNHAEWPKLLKQLHEQHIFLGRYTRIPFTDQRGKRKTRLHRHSELSLDTDRIDPLLPKAFTHLEPESTDFEEEAHFQNQIVKIWG